MLAFTLHRLKRRRPGFAIGMPIVVGVGIRLLAIAGVSSSGLETSLRGGDETTFLTYARLLSHDPFGHGFWPHGNQYPLHTVVFAIQMKFGGFTEGALRVTQVGIATLGIVFLAAAVHDLAGPRAARITTWVLAFEPASIFFNSALHKEPLMVLASGLMVFGASKMWRRLDLTGIAIMALAGLIAVKTRPYAGWFLISAGVLIILHASLRRMDRPLKAMPLVYAVIIAGFIAAPAITQVTSKKSLNELQQSQNANTDPSAISEGANTNNLALERVDYSTRGKVFQNLPNRMLDVVVRPYPWQVSNPSQQLGAVGSLFALTAFVLLDRRRVATKGGGARARRSDALSRVLPDRRVCAECRQRRNQLPISHARGDAGRCRPDRAARGSRSGVANRGESRVDPPADPGAWSSPCSRPMTVIGADFAATVARSCTPGRCRTMTPADDWHDAAAC